MFAGSNAGDSLFVACYNKVTAPALIIANRNIMKKIYLSLLLLIPALYSRGQEQPAERKVALFADLQLISAEVQAVYNLFPKTNIYAGTGYGIAVLTHYNGDRYLSPMGNQDPKGVNILPRPMLAFFYNIGIQQRLYTPKVTAYDFFLYARGQFRHYMPTNTSQENELYGQQFRTALLAGLQHYMDKKHKWVLAFELGAALWSNYNLRHHAGGPQLNLHIARKLL